MAAAVLESERDASFASYLDMLKASAESRRDEEIDMAREKARRVTDAIARARETKELGRTIFPAPDNAECPTCSGVMYCMYKRIDSDVACLKKHIWHKHGRYIAAGRSGGCILCECERE